MPISVKLLKHVMCKLPINFLPGRFMMLKWQNLIIITYNRRWRTTYWCIRHANYLQVFDKFWLLQWSNATNSWAVWDLIRVTLQNISLLLYTHIYNKRFSNRRIDYIMGVHLGIAMYREIFHRILICTCLNA